MRAAHTNDRRRPGALALVIAWLALACAGGGSESVPDGGPAGRSEAAGQGGADFHAVGQEPGWLLDIYEGERIEFVGDYGETRIVTPAPAPDGRGPRTTYEIETDAHALTIVILDQPCRDAMSGAPFPATVTVTLDGREYRGCGRALR